MLGQSWGHLWMTLGLLRSTFDNCWQCWSHLAVILEGLGGYLSPPWGYLGRCLGYVGASLAIYSSNVKQHTSLKCYNRSRSAPVERECNFKKQRCHRSSKSHTSLNSINPSRSAPVEQKRTNPKPYTQPCPSHIETHMPP